MDTKSIEKHIAEWVRLAKGWHASATEFDARGKGHEDEVAYARGMTTGFLCAAFDLARAFGLLESQFCNELRAMSGWADDLKALHKPEGET